MKEKILQCQREAEPLEPSGSERGLLEKHASEFADRFIGTLPRQNVYRPFVGSAKSLLVDSFSEEPSGLNDVIRQYEEEYLEPGLNASSGGQLGFIPGGGLFASAVADYLAAVTNPYTGIYYSSPGTVCLESSLIHWMAGLAGYPETAGGYLSSGGSLANLTAVVAAREGAGIQAEEITSTAIYVTDQVHHCVSRALHISGMGTAVIRKVPLNHRYQMRPEVLAELIERDLHAGLRPWLVVASAGTTNTGSIDPLEEIGAITRKFGLWFHVDAAYGGCFLLTEEGREKMKGIERSDSLVIDPHKGFFVPYGLGALIVRDVKKLAGAFQYSAEYLQDTWMDQPVYSPAELSPELSKHFRGLRLWLPLKLYGVRAFRAALDEKLLLAKYAWKRLNEIDLIETGPEPELSVVTFRYVPETGDIESANRALHEAIVKDGRVYITTTRIGGEYMLRVAILTLRTHLADIDRFQAVLMETVKKLSKEPPV